MKKAILLIFIPLLLTSCQRTESQTSNNANQEIEQKVDSLLSVMTLEEKVGQMTQITYMVVEKQNAKGALDKDKLKEAIQKYHIGSILNVPEGTAPTRERWQEILEEIQTETNKSNLKIPVLFGIDAIHGSSYTQGATLFPQQIGMAATWNPELIKRGAQISAYETRASNIPWVFSPDLDLPRNPTWSRFWETFGEDTYLSSQMATAMVEGFQGDDISAPNNVAACVKHFLGYGSTTTGKDRTPSIIPERVLRQYDLPIHAAGAKAGAKTFMISSGEINGTPVHASKKLLTDVLKGELGFEGFVVSDWEDIIYLHNRHKVAATPKEAVKIGVMAGIDMSMVPNDFSFFNYLVELVNEGEVPMSRIDDAVSRILKVKLEVGLFEKPTWNTNDYSKFGSDEFIQEAYNTAAESITLLKNNDGLLPILKDAKILVTGPTANTMKSLNSGWTYNWQGENADKFAADKMTILEAFQDKLGTNNVLYSEGVSLTEEINIEKTVSLAKNADYILLCLGEQNYTETPGDISDLEITEPQIALAKALSKLNKPIILVLAEGRPRIISKFESEMDAVVHAYYPGNEGGRALVDIITGDVNPSGKIPFNYPRYTNALTKYNRKYTESREGVTGHNAYNPQWEFGHGLSYTTFEYSNLKLSSTEIKKGDTIDVSIDVTNTGSREGKEVVQLYLNDLFASITPEVKKLVGFEKISLNPNETKTVTLKITEESMSFVDNNLDWVSQDGTFKVMIADKEMEFELN
ncbi:beta-glucosidase [Flaviramulus basaltis]|uniref:beta-glucosidase n=1 Tax=Flaviramulus basaltis TaxID=369401 RepID=A0A1K2IMC3_9FLAO|nr:glycoside hydrolase family 3 N-terminal domain-containing protein [Flaviramulus basaltis]SFZ93454.1 beta-glucosidase [Flaviramulus basaltis]